ncbi:MAG: DUF2220 family protein [Clostridiales bacterium]|nr:DUF2220 family protein [Clostridiales bacterium]
MTGIVFDCRSDSSRQERFFLYDGVLPENCFIERGEAIDIPTLRTFLKQRYGVRAKLYDSQKQYRTDMLAKWNVHNEQVTRMMKKAVSFRPIVDIQKFITENICDIPERPDIEAMQQNIRDYKRHEQLAQRQEEKLAALEEISRLYREMQQAIDRWQQHSFLVLWAQKEELDGEYHRRTLERQDCAAGIEKEAAEFDTVSAKADEKEHRRTELRIACAQSDVSREEDRLRSSKERLLSEQQTLLVGLQKDAMEIRREAGRLCSLCRTVLAWPDSEEVRPVLAAARAVAQAYAGFDGCDYHVFAQPLALFEGAQQAAADFSAAVRDAAYRIKVLMDDLKGAQDQKAAALANLRKNVKDYPRGLLRLKARLASELEKRVGRPVEIDILADVLEIPASEEKWRSAVEGYLNTQKFYLLIDPACYQDALQIYDRIKREFHDHSFGLVDVGKLREQERIAPRDDSLARKIETDHALARSYIDYLLGRVVCCANVEQLREHRTAITPDGMVYQGYVARPLRKELMEDAFIGRRAVALRISRLETELAGLQAEVQRWKPVYQALSVHQNHTDLFSQYFVQSVVAQRQADYLRGQAISGELERVEDQLSALDLFWLEEHTIRDTFLRIALNYHTGLAAACAQGEMGAREQLAYLGIYARPELYELSGACGIVTRSGVIEVAAATPYGLALPSTGVDAILSVDLRELRRIILIENKTNYDEYILTEQTREELVLYHGGFLSPQKRKWLSKFADALTPEIETFFWADIDLGGFQMFTHLQAILPGLRPMRMSGAEVTAYRSRGLARSEDYLSTLRTALEAGEYPLFRDAIERILEYGVTIEQEAFLSP